MSQSQKKRLDIIFLHPELNHENSDNIGDILGPEDKAFWKDHKSAKINQIRIQHSIEKADVVVVKFGDNYRQWNAAFESGLAHAKGKSLIIIHDDKLTHALKEIDSVAKAVTDDPLKVADILQYINK